MKAKKSYKNGGRTVTKELKDGVKSRTVTRKLKDGSTKVKSKVKEGNTVTKRKVTTGPIKYSSGPTTRIIVGEGNGERELSAYNQIREQSVKGKETVKNRKAKKGEAKKTKSKIDGTRTSTRSITSSYRRYRGDRGEASKFRVTPASKTVTKKKIKK